MNTSDSATPRDETIADQNVERLLVETSQPETYDERFVQHVREQVHLAAKRLRHESAVVRPDKRLVTRSPWAWPLVASGATVAAVVMVIAFVAGREPRPPESPSYYRDGQLVWIDGKLYVAASAAYDEHQGAPMVPVLGHQQTRSAQDEFPRIDDALTARERPQPVPIEQAAAGATLVTGAGERRMIGLSDGSILYVNENSAVTVDADRQITLERGEVFLEVRSADADSSKFVVETPQRDITALGTKFGVTVNESGTGVVVTQGKVQVTGVTEMIEAGQRLLSGTAEDRNVIAPLSRASHVLRWTRDLMAAAESPLVPSSEYRGGALVAIDRDGQQMKLSLRKYHVDVHIEDGFARTTIDQTYFNHHTGRLEGTFYFPLPPEASISRLAMYVNGRLMEGGMVERNRARQVFETIKHRSLDPALLEWMDGSTFKMRVFPLEGRQEKRIVLSYTQKLDNHYGEIRYRFPAGHTMESVRHWSVQLRLVNASQWTWACTSHQLKSVETDRDLLLTAEESNAKFDRDVVVDFHDKNASGSRDGEQPRFSSFDHERWRYLMLRFRPQLPAVERPQRRDWIFLVEADGSRDPLLARVQADIVRGVLENAEYEDTFAIITAASRRAAFAPESKPVNRDNIQAAAEFLDTMHLVGALDLEQALAATRPYVGHAKNPVLVHIGDGTPILGERQSDRLLQNLPERVRYVGIGVGKRWNRNFMKSAASQTGGYFTQINPDESTAWRVFELMSALNAPRVLDLCVESNSSETEFLCFKDWAVHGEEICAIARYQADQTAPKTVNITGSIDGQPYKHTVSVNSVREGAGYLPRLWAKLAIDQMVARDAQQHKTEIIELSKSMYVMSPFTSLLVLENDAMYEQYAVDRGRKDHWALYPCPKKIDVVYEPLGPGLEIQRYKTADKPTAAEVLQSLLVRDPAVLRVVSDYQVPMLGKPPHMVWEVWDRDLAFETANMRMMVTPTIIVDEEAPLDDRFRFDQSGNGVIDIDSRAAVSDFDALIELITATVEPKGWEQLGGPGLIDPFPGNLSLVISQSQAFYDPRSERMVTNVYPVADLVLPIGSSSAVPQGLHDMSRRAFVDALHIVEEADIPFPDEAPLGYPDAKLWDQITRSRKRYQSLDLPSEQHILATLDKVTDVDYDQRPLKEVIDELVSRHAIPMIVDTSTLEDYGVATDEPVTLQANDIALRDLLDLILEPLDLAYVIQDEVLLITAVEEASSRSITPAFWHDEIVGPLYIERQGSSNVRRRLLGGPSMNDDLRVFNRLCDDIRGRLVQDVSAPNLLYNSPKPFNNRRMFRHLMTFVPAFRTSWADVLSTLNVEAELPNAPHRGDMDERARELIAQARRGSWQQVTLRDRAGHTVLQVHVDGPGRFRYERKTEYGLLEIAVCDGHTLRHLYPELGVGTERLMSRFHRAELFNLIPWLLPPAEDLATGCDLRVIEPSTIAIVPHDVDTDDNGSPRPHVRVHLVFADDGRLAEQHLVSIPSGETLVRTTYEADGTVRLFRQDGTLQATYQMYTEPASQPDLSPDTTHLVMLPTPVRDRNHIYALVHKRNEATTVTGDPIGDRSDATSQEGGILKRIAEDQFRSKDPAAWSEEDALRLVAACYWHDATEMRDVIARRFFARGDRRLGFYTLLLSSGIHWRPAEVVDLSDSATIRMDPVADHPDSPLARYVDWQLRGSEQEVRDSVDSKNGFIAQLSQYCRLSKTWRRIGNLPSDAEVRQRELDEAFDFIRQTDSPMFALALLRRIQHRYGDAQPHGHIADALLTVEKQGLTSYVVKYELARSLAISGKRVEAWQLFQALYRESLEQGLLPPIDSAFSNAGGTRKDPFGGPSDIDNAQLRFDDVMYRACDQLIEQHRRPAAVALAWQCRQLGYERLADQLVDQAVTGLPDSERSLMTLVAVDYLARTERFDRVKALLQPLLEDSRYAGSASLWRLAAQIADDGGKLARSVAYLETAVDLDYEALSGTYDVSQVRSNYQQLFGQYEQLASTLDAPDTDPPLDLIVRTIRQADRWRSLETDITIACKSAASLLNMLGQTELAWDYLTTPLAMKPSEAAPWLDLAKSVAEEGQLELANHAYATAFEADPTNAQILWDHAQLLERWGHSKDAQKLYAQIASSQWEQRFDSLKQRAQRRWDLTTEDTEKVTR